MAATQQQFNAYYDAYERWHRATVEYHELILTAIQRSVQADEATLTRIGVEMDVAYRAWLDAAKPIWG